MKKYVLLTCSVCDRSTKELVDLKRFTPDKCTITLGCEGRLLFKGYTNDNSSVDTVPPTGTVNWYKRGTKLTPNTSLKTVSLFNLSTGGTKQLVLAVKKSLLPADTSGVIELGLEGPQQTSKDYRQYTYRKTTSFDTVNGVEDGASKKVLRYSVLGSDPDIVQVYLNGVLKEQGVDYELYDGVAAVAPNSVKFTSTVSGSSNQVDVIVSKAGTKISLNLTFARQISDESRVGTGAWEGVQHVTSIDDYALFYCDGTTFVDLSPLNVTFTLSSLTYVLGGVQYSLSDAYFLLSRSGVHTQVDRNLAAWVPLSGLTADTKYVTIAKQDNEKWVFCTEDSIAPVFPVLNVTQYTTRTLLTTGLTGDSSSAEYDSTLIKGPDR
jgi:hypothetical protein